MAALLLCLLAVQVRLTKKFAGMLNGLDLRQSHVGDVIDVDPRAARMLIVEGWAELYPIEITSAADHARLPRRKAAPKTPA